MVGRKRDNFALFLTDRGAGPGSPGVGLTTSGWGLMSALTAGGGPMRELLAPVL